MAFWRSKKESASDAQPDDSASVVSISTGGRNPNTGGGLLSKMRSGLQKTRRALNTDIRDLFKSEGRLVDESSWAICTHD